VNHIKKLWKSAGGGTMPKPSMDGSAHLDSKLLDVGNEGWGGERPDDFLFSDFGTFTRHLGDTAEGDSVRLLADAHVLLLMSDITARRGTHTVVFQDDGGQGGLYVRVDVTPETIDVAFVSNYAQLEYKEAWYQAVLSLYEWYSYPTGTFNVNIYRKSWPRPQTTLNIATQLSEIIVYIFDVMRSGSFRLLVSNLEQFPRLKEELAELVVWPIETDFTFAERAVRLTREVGIVPPPTANSIQQERNLGTTNVARAYDIAAMNDDEVGMTSLSEIVRLLRMRSRYLSDMRDVLVDILYN